MRDQNLGTLIESIQRENGLSDNDIGAFFNITGAGIRKWKKEGVTLRKAAIVNRIIKENFINFGKPVEQRRDVPMRISHEQYLRESLNSKKMQLNEVMVQQRIVIAEYEVKINMLHSQIQSIERQLESAEENESCDRE